MELALVIWFISALSGIATMFGWFMFLSIIAFIASLGCYIFSHDPSYADNGAPLKVRAFGAKGMKIFVSTFILFSTLFVLTPSTKTGWMMAGGYVAQTTIQSDSAKKFAKIVELKLEEVLDEATKQAKIKAGSINEKKE